MACDKIHSKRSEIKTVNLKQKEGLLQNTCVDVDIGVIPDACFVDAHFLNESSTKRCSFRASAIG